MSHHPESFAAQFESMSGLSRWLLWLGLMTVTMVIFGLAMFYRADQAIENGMYFVIGLLAAVLIAKGFFDVRFLDRETRLASQQVRILEAVDDFETFLARAERSVFRSHIDNLYTISLSQQEISQDNLIQVLHERLLARNRLIDLFASILITLGLIGTIVGLILMTGDLKQAMANPTAGSDLLGGLTASLSGLDTAFYTTLLGAVLGGVVLRVLTNVVDTNVMRYTAHLAELTEVHVLPYMRKLARARHAASESPRTSAPRHVELELEP